MTEKIPINAQFKFTYLSCGAIPDDYLCTSFDELITKTRANPFLTFPGIGQPFLEESKNVRLKSYYYNPAPFDVQKLDTVNNLAHIWLYQAYFLDPNHHESKNFYFSFWMRPINQLDEMFMKSSEDQQKKQSELRRELATMFVRGVDEIIADYCEDHQSYTLFVNGLVQLYLYIHVNCKRDCLLNRYKCDHISFSPAGFGFEPLTYLFHCTQKSGFHTYSLTPRRKFQTRFMEPLAEAKEHEETNVDIDIPSLVYKYEIATGKPDDEMLERNKKKLCLPNEKG